jgi:predicted nucleic acid-binding protein
MTMTLDSVDGPSGLLIDTNILIYAYDPRDRAKQRTATSIVEALIAARRAVLSVQCLSEFFSVATNKLPQPLTRSEARDEVQRFARACRVLDLTPGVALEGCRGAAELGLSIWDALIWAAAKLNQVPYVLTEDAEHGRFLEGVRFANPFAPAFDPGALGIRL